MSLYYAVTNSPVYCRKLVVHIGSPSQEPLSDRKYGGWPTDPDKRRNHYQISHRFSLQWVLWFCLDRSPMIEPWAKLILSAAEMPQYGPDGNEKTSNRTPSSASEENPSLSARKSQFMNMKDALSPALFGVG
jgi:hypothetical protein